MGQICRFKKLKKKLSEPLSTKAKLELLAVLVFVHYQCVNLIVCAHVCVCLCEHSRGIALSLEFLNLPPTIQCLTTVRHCYCSR